MRILLINTPVWKLYGARLSYNPSLGLLYLGSVLRENGHEVRILDAEALKLCNEDILEEISDWNATHVGLSCLSNGLIVAIDICKTIKNHFPSVWVSMGGAGPSCDIETAKISGADSYCVGEGELVIEKVFAERGVHIGEPVEDLDSLPFPAYDLLEPKPGTGCWFGNNPKPDIKPIREISVMWSRGCPHHCTFCSKAVIRRGNPRLRNSENIVKELKYLHETFGINSVFVYDDELIGLGDEHNKWLYNVLEHVHKWNLNDDYSFKISLKGQGRCNKTFVTEETGLMLKDAGFFAMMMGCESGSEKVRKRVKKGTTDEDIITTLKTLSKWVSIYGFWMIGLPEETEEEVMKTEKMIRDNSKYMRWIQITPLSPIRGSDFWNEVEKSKWFSKEFKDYFNIQETYVLNMPWLSAVSVYKLRRKLFKAYEEGTKERE